VADAAQTIIDDQHSARAVHLRQEGQWQIDTRSLADQFVVIQVGFGRE